MKRSAQLFLFFIGFGSLFSGVSFAAWNQTISSTVEINDLTTNGPVLLNSDVYGNAVANIGDLNGDGVNDLAVGAYQDDTGGSGRGAIHIHFLNTDGSVDSTVKIDDTTLNGPVLINNDLYGVSVANIGDLNGDGVNDLAVGAYGDDAGGTNRGAVHIHFMNVDGSIDATVEINDTTLNGPVLLNSDLYGNSVANIGDLNGDGVNDLAVGAYQDDTGGSGRGAMHLHFMNVDGSVDSTVKIDDTTLNGPVLLDSDNYGISVANIGDLNGDGVNDLVVGAYFDAAGGLNRGAIHIHFMNTDGSVDSTVEINDTTPNGPVLLDWDVYGASVANLGDLNGDSVTDLAVGAYFDAAGGLDRGAIHIHFMNIDGSVDSTVEINDTTPNGPVLLDSDFYGTSIANLGDLNGDGATDLAVGAQGDDAGGSSRGAVHISFLNNDVSAPVISGIFPATATVSSDPTPTYTFSLNENGSCRLSLFDESYTDMSNDTDCTGDGTQSITCQSPDLGVDGTKNIYLACLDSWTNFHTSSNNSTVTYILDSTAPENSTVTAFATNEKSDDDILYTSSRSITLDTTSTGASEMIISENADFSGASWVAYAESYAFTLSEGDGLKTIYSKYRDAVGNETAAFTTTILLDSKDPSKIKVGRAKDDLFDIGAKTLVLKTTDINELDKAKLYFDTYDKTTDVSHLRVSYSKNDMEDRDWKEYDGDHSIKLPTDLLNGIDTKIRLYIQFKDHAGNETKIYGQNIQLENSGTLEKIGTIIYDPQYKNYFYTENYLVFSGRGKINIEIDGKVYNTTNAWTYSTYLENGSHTVKVGDTGVTLTVSRTCENFPAGLNVCN